MVIDLRGSPTGLEGLGEALAQLFRDPNDQVRAFFLENEEVGAQIAEASREQSRRLQRGEGISPAQVKALGDANIPTETLSLPALPGGGLVPPEILAELLQRHPETPEMKREREVRELTRGEITAEEEAGGRAAERRAQITRARLEGRVAGDELTFLDALEERGLGQDEKARIAALRFANEARGLEIEGVQQETTQAMASKFAEFYAGLPEDDRDLLTLGATPGSQYLAQSMLQEKAYDQQLVMEGLRQRTANARTREEILDARLSTVFDINEEIDRVLGEIEETDDKNLLPSLVSRVNSLGEMLLLIDPQAHVATATLKRGLFDGIKGVEFGTTDVIQDNPTRFEQQALKFRELGMTREALAQLEEANTDPLTGSINQNAVNFVTGLAAELEATGNQRRDDNMRRAAQEAVVRNDPEVMEAELQQALTAFNNAMTGVTPGLTTPELNELWWDIQYFRLRNFFYAGTPRRLEVEPGRGIGGGR